MAIPVMQDQTEGLMKGMNEQWCDPMVDPNLMREPRRYIYMYTVSKREFMIERPPLTPCLRVPACGPKERYKLFARIPDPVTQAVRDDNGRLKGEAHLGMRVAIDLICPDNITLNPEWEMPTKFAALATGYGCDYRKQGLGISLNNPPTEEEIKKWEGNRHKYYEALRQMAVLNETGDSKKMVEELANNSDYHLMADYFGLEFFWHKTVKVMVTCPNCMEKIPEGAAFHMSGGARCVLDWKRSVEAGVVKLEDVPEGKRWAGENWPKRPRSSGAES